MFKHLIWDFDGTLFDTYTAQTEILSGIMSGFGYEISADEVRKLTAVSLSSAIDALAAGAGAGAEEISELFISRYGAVPLDREFPYEGAKDVCERVTACGGMNMINTHRGGERLRRLLAHYEMDGLFAEIVCRDDGYPRKPDPASYAELLRRSGVSADNVLMVGDRPLDVEGGRRAGIRGYLFNSNGIDTAAIDCEYKEADLLPLLDLIG